MDVWKSVTRRVIRTSKTEEPPHPAPCSFCGGPSRPGVEGDNAVICASCVREAARMLDSLEDGER